MSKITFKLHAKSGEDTTLTSEKIRDNGAVITKKTVIESKEQIERREWKERLGLIKADDKIVYN